MNKTVGILTLGCKVNQYESEAIGEALVAQGFTLCAPSEVCDVYVINTCTVTAESDRKARQFIRRALSHNPKALVAVTGCLAQTDAAGIAAIPGVDYICGNRNKMSVVSALLSLCEQGHKNTSPTVDVPSLDGADFETMSICRFGRTRAYIKIEDGCESHCTYCIIPAARGEIRSKPLEAVLDEVECLTENGCREVVLTGIETASWGRDLDGVTLADLLEAVDRIPGIGRVRLGSLDPTLMRPAFVERIARLPSLAPHFHLSMQSGSDSVLARMKRKYNRTQALAAIERLRAAIPGVQLTTDIIVGFPGETEEDFEATMDFARRARFLMIHVFPYSKRAGTPAAAMPDQIPNAVKKQRVAALSALAADIRAQLLDELIDKGEPVSVLFETHEDGIAVGHTPDFIEMRVPSDHALHAVTRLVLPTAKTEDLSGCYGQLI
ncbi:MAG: tRNA (N(6)-L-threonylcarbamoyladenosine(37)-C(2))-methylthiotransferase MtaB [Ruminococcaceae bacterium]|nr:tRNA (N(6)-L-threonylcarbamoyladenosine(37)-C(2))-methylthiotransferase MtaB [Oscillospiraceae bacterium]